MERTLSRLNTIATPIINYYATHISHFQPKTQKYSPNTTHTKIFAYFCSRKNIENQLPHAEHMELMEPIKQTWKTSRNKEIFSWYIQPVSKPKAVILLVHGFGEYSWRYKHWANKFAYTGYAFVSWDHCGHGLSDGRPGFIRNYEQFLLEIDLAITKTKELFPDIPIILYGHSMGGNIAINYAIRRTSPISLLIITSPWLELANPLPKYQEILIVLLMILLPRVTLKAPIKAEQISHDEEEVTKYRTDKLIHGIITPKLLMSIKVAGKYAQKNANKIKIPTLLMHGNADSITSCKATMNMARLIPNATYLEWPSLFHELHKETKQNEIFMNISEWIEHYLPA